jgi:hypothetical protein
VRIFRNINTDVEEENSDIASDMIKIINSSLSKNIRSLISGYHLVSHMLQQI